MAFLDLYTNLSNFSLYKSDVYRLGINSLLVFNVDGIPFIARDYSDNELKTSNDFIFLSAFISSVLKFIKIEGNGYITDFGIGTSRFYLKFDRNETIYCLVLNELIHRRVTGEQLIIFVEVTTNELKKIFNYYRNDGTHFLQKDSYDEKFCLKIDRLFLDTFHDFITSAYKTQEISEYLFDHNILVNPPSNNRTGVPKKLLDLGIKGLLVCVGKDKPLAFRNYEKTIVENVDGAFFVCGLSNLLNKFALSNFGFFTDVGFGFQRVIFKFKTENNLTLCLILSEILYRRVTGETLHIFSELMLKRIHKSIKIKMPNLRELAQSDGENSMQFEIDILLDNLLLENAKSIYEELKV